MDAARSDSGAPTGTPADEVVAVCVWTTACLNTEDSYAGAAPITNVGSCLATYESNHGNGIEPWDEFRACLAANPSSCTEFRQCLLDREAICPLPPKPGELPDWTEGFVCPGGGRSCSDSACVPGSCPSSGIRCVDETTALDCTARPAYHRCATECVTVTGFGDSCAPGEAGACTGGPSAACDGDVAVLCQADVEMRLDCSAYGMPCRDGRCAQGSECTYMDDACEGDVLHTCLGGYRRDVDCAALGGTCGPIRGAREACRLPEGTPLDAGSDGGLDGGSPMDAGSETDAGTDGGLDAGVSMDAPVCTALDFGGPMVHATAVAGPVPTWTGGAITPGVYHLVEIRMHDGAPFDPTTWLQRTTRFAGDALGRPVETIQRDVSGRPTERLAGSYSTPGTDRLSFWITCGASASGSEYYTATPTTLHVGLSSNPNLVYVYALDATIADAGMSDAGSSADARGACAAITAGGPFVPQTMMPGSLPPFAGGTIVDGTYDLTAYEVYAPGTAGSGSLQITVVFSGGRFERLANAPGLSAPQITAGTYSTSGTGIALDFSCPTVAMQTAQYTATATTLSFSGPPGHRTIFTRR